MKNRIVLRKNEEHRIAAGHLWIFSNEIKTIEGTPEPGDVVEVSRSDGKFLGVGFYHPHSLIAVRILSRQKEEISSAFFEQRLSRALALRRSLYPGEETFRLVHGEGDYLPGLIIDKYNEFLVLQILSTGMERRISTLCDILESLFHPRAIIARNESPLRELEKLPAEVSVLRGTLDQTIIDEYGVKYKVDLLEGHKTGAFLDQRENRFLIRRLSKDRDVLDCFCNEGGFALHASAGGARSVQGVDSSASALARAKVNSAVNQAEAIAFVKDDTFDHLRILQEQSQQFDVINLDPPSFTRSKKAIPAALRAYRDLNRLALGLIRPGGYLLTSSCSHHISEESFLQAIEAAAQKARRSIQLLMTRGAAPDHPILPAMPETRYLKFAIFAVT